jgi:hypothetical protein
MAAHHRWATVATVTAAFIIGIQGTAAADTVSGSGSVPATYPIVVCGVPTAGTTTGTTPTTTSTTPGTPPTTSGTSPTTSTTTPTNSPTTSTGTTYPPQACIGASGNVFIFYIFAVTTTTTITTVSAPILAANGAITWVTGVPIVPAASAVPAGTSTAAATATGQGAAATGQGAAAAGGWVQCTATSTSTVTNASTVRCPITPPGSASGKGKLKLMCEPAPVAKAAHVRVASQAHRPARKSTRGHKKRSTHYVVYCRSM